MKTELNIPVITPTLIETALQTLAVKSSGNAVIRNKHNNVDVTLEFMLEHGRVWVLSHHDKTKMKLEKLSDYLNSL